MTTTRFIGTLALVLALPAFATASSATSSAAKPTAKSSKPAKKSAPPIFVPPAAMPEQVDAATRVYYGSYECELKQTLDIAASAQHPAYVDLKLGKNSYLMKPVLSTTGAVRLEDVKGKTLLVQIANKSMLLNVGSGQRMADNCMHAKQRELTDAATTTPQAPA